jgi:glyoxylate reductase
MSAVFVTRQIPEVGLAMLREKGYEVDVSTKDGILTKEELIEALKTKSYEAVLCLLTDKIDAEVMDASSDVKIFANYAIGYDNFDLEAAKARQIILTNTPGAMTPKSVAEHTMALLFTVAKHITEADAFTKSGQYDGWNPMRFIGADIDGKTLGIIGAGRIGSNLARYARGFNLRIVYYDVARNEKFEKETGAEYRASVDALLPEADFISLHVPLLDSTHHLIDERRLGLMKRTAILINTSRGSVVDEVALVQALQNKVIRGAGLDVFEFEPQLATGLADLSNVVLTPHIASATESARAEMATMAAENIIAALEGREAPNRL